MVLPISRSTVRNTGAGSARYFELYYIDILWSMLVLSGMLPTHHVFQWVGSAGCYTKKMLKSLSSRRYSLRSKSMAHLCWLLKFSILCPFKTLL